MAKRLGSIDLGTHTARLLVAETWGPPIRLIPLSRKRAYVRLAEGFDPERNRQISPEGIKRVLGIMKDFSREIDRFGVGHLFALATGVVREAANQKDLIASICDDTGIDIRVITGEREAELTAKGVLYGLDFRTGPIRLFDLGGGSTEFLFKQNDSLIVKSSPVGAAVLTQRFIKSDPPKEEEIDALSLFIDASFSNAGLKPDNRIHGSHLVGTGGTVTAIAALQYGIARDEITPDRMNGCVIQMPDLEAIFDKIRHMDIDKRMKLPGMTPGRAGVILAGVLIVIKIMNILNSTTLTVSLSDLLEGVLIDFLEGEAK
jgi:exopolyphosphatase/guanosine-5'-triphosphate,3'-diphosphate pyrophosphatase